MPENFTCPTCGHVSHHPMEVAHSYCAACHRFDENRPEPIRCDICSVAEPRPIFSYPVKPFVWGVPVGQLVDSDIVVCRTCAGFIDAGDRETLLRRGFEGAGPWEGVPPLAMRIFRANIHSLHAGYWAHANGPGRRVESYDELVTLRADTAHAARELNAVLGAWPRPRPQR